jgi:hypothetical protein
MLQHSSATSVHQLRLLANMLPKPFLVFQVPIFTQGNLGFAFALREDYACHVHLSSSPVWVCLSPASYWHIIDLCCGMFSMMHMCKSS